MSIDELQTPTAPAPTDETANTAPGATLTAPAPTSSPTAPEASTELASDLDSSTSAPEVPTPSAPVAETAQDVNSDPSAPNVGATSLGDTSEGSSNEPSASITAAIDAPTTPLEDTIPSGDAAQPVQASAPVQSANDAAPGQPDPANIPSGDASSDASAMNTPAETTASTPEIAAPATPVEPPKAEVVAADDTFLFEQYMTNPGSVDVNVAAADGHRHQKGEKVKGRIVDVRNDRLLIDIGSKSEATIPSHELSKPAIEYVVGEEMSVVVIKPEGGESGATVSRKKAEQEEQWDGIVSAFENGTSIKANVVERVKGGLTVDLAGVRGFVPATHVGNGKIRNLDRFAGTELELKIIELDKERKKVVLSNREAEAEQRATKKDEIFGKLKVDDVLEGTVRRLTDYGAFVDLGGVDGLLHISEMSWARIGHPKEIFKEGDTIPVKVLRLDKGTEKISLGHKQVLPDPWLAVKTNYTVGQSLTIPITRLVASGAFIRLPEGAEAFMPVSEMSDRRINDPSEVLEPGQEAEVKIIELKPEARRMVLSIRATKPGYEPRPDTSGYRGEPDFRNGARGPGGPRRGPGGRDGGEESTSRRGFATGGATIGERLGMLKGLLRDGDGGSAPKDDKKDE